MVGRTRSGPSHRYGCTICQSAMPPRIRAFLHEHGAKMQPFARHEAARQLSLLYLRFAILSPSPTVARVGDGAVFGV